MARRYKNTTRYRKRSRTMRSLAQRAARKAVVASRRFRRRRKRRPFGIMRNPFTMDKVTTNLRYCTNISLNPQPEALTSVTNIWQFCSNGLFDPDTTGFGHQPMYFDNYSALYQKYRVIRSSIHVTVVNHFVNTATSTSTGTVTIQPNYSYRLFIANDGTSGSTTDFAANMEQMIEEGGPDIRWRFIAPSLNGTLPKLRHFVTPAKLKNLSPKDDSLEAVVTLNPAAATYWYVGIAAADGNTDPPAVYLYVTINYVVEFFDRKNVQAQN